MSQSEGKAKGGKSGKRAKESLLIKKLKQLWARGQSELCEVQGSRIHGRGVYATQAIPAGTKIIEYVGERIDKQESERRAWAQHDKAKKHGDAAVYIFTLDDKWDIDGDLPWNTARLINHSCEPNCEAWIEGRRIFIHSLRDIAAGEELTFDYAFDVECYEDHPCLCGRNSCVGYIVGRDQWPRLKEILADAKRG
ncbi:MAG: SET domain-containing protein [Verrucomicrobia bacterium]|nr:MAG: SET domain-containing protein [Verrucomicrobiota bacterium]TAE87711.1 MAG: SET domain-containing protein [Verrucomicrobiota bacterium]TAF25355.1 MAG: SET domain-containing protein [Verrucomicrobiota bacterium]TAF41142.1 MAG: SET domain-containing protein [Verrucomicrobiota bacterium]